MVEYKVQFEVFEGPLDLLLYLVKQEEVDIYQVNLTKLATQFLEYVDLMRELDLDIAGEFLVMAATLMYIKSRELLPRDQQVIGQEEEEDQDDPRWELIRRLVEYKKFKDAAARLQQLEFQQEQVYHRNPPRPELERLPARVEASVFDLVTAVNAVLRRIKENDTTRDVVEDRWTVSEKIEFVRQMIASRGSFTFAELFGDTTSRAEVVATFLALLELIRLGIIQAIQLQPFGEIEISSAPTQPAHAAVPTPPLPEKSPAETAASPPIDSHAAAGGARPEAVPPNPP